MRGPFISILVLVALASPAKALQSVSDTISLTSSSNPAVYGATVSIKVSVTGTPGYPMPTGTVTLIDATSTNSSTLATMTLDSAGTAQAIYPVPVAVGGSASIPGNVIYMPFVLGAGTHNISAVYTGDTVYPYIFTKPLVQQIQPAKTSIGVTSALTSQGSSALTATVVANDTPLPCPAVTGSDLHDGSPSGTVQFFNGGQSLGVMPLVQDAQAGCVAAVTVGIPQINGSIVATYSGDSNFAASTYGAAEGPSAALLPTSVTIDATPDSPTIAQAITLTATVSTGDSGVPPTGVVQFFVDGVKLLGTANVVATKASLVVTLGAGSHSMSANYSGDALYQPSSLSFGEYVARLPGTLTVAASTSSTTYGQPVTFTAQLKTQSVTGVASPTGTVQFYAGCMCGLFGGFAAQSTLGIGVLTKGAATLTVSNLPAGADQVEATYSGDDSWVTASTAPLAVTVSKAATTTSWITLGSDAQSASLVATAAVATSASGAPTGTVQVLDSSTGAVLASAPLSASGSATATFAAKASAVVASYSGDSNFAASASPAASFLAVADAAGFGTATLAPDEIVSLFGSGLAAQTSSALSAGASGPSVPAAPPVQILDSAGTSFTPALLLYSPTQINLTIPSAVASGTAKVTVLTPSGATLSRSVAIASVAPGLFAANGGGTGPAAAQIVRVHADGSQAIESTVALDSAGKQWVAAPIAFGSDTLYLVLYGTGIRHRSDNANVTCNIGGKVLPVAYSSAQGASGGLDQVNVALPATLAGAGSVSVTVTADGQSSNALTLFFK